MGVFKVPKHKYIVPFYTPSRMRNTGMGLADPEGMEPTRDP